MPLVVRIQLSMREVRVKVSQDILSFCAFWGSHGPTRDITKVISHFL
jgi:hypothetical protein